MALLAHTAAQDTLDGATTSAVDTTGATNIQIHVASFASAAEPTPTDSEGNVWRQLGAVTAHNTRLRTWYCLQPATSATHTFSVSQTGSYPAVAVQAHDGATPFVDANTVSSTAGTSDTSLAAGSVTPLSDDDLVVCAWGFAASGVPTGFSIDNGFTALGVLPNVSGQSFGIAHGYKYLSGGDGVALTPEASWTGATGAASSCAAFVTDNARAFVRDTFTDSDATALQSHTGEEGASWTERTASNDVTISGNAAVAPATGGPVVYTASGTPSSAEYDVLGVIVPTAGSNRDLALLGRYADLDNFYMAQRESGSWRLIKNVAGSLTELSAAAETVSAGIAYSVRLRLRDGAQTLYVNGAVKAVGSDTDLTAAGLAGVRGSGIDLTLDYFQAENVAGGGGGSGGPRRRRILLCGG